ncbi:putative ABC transport system permease protein [Arthrobacter pigmenti]|uniref:Putative ABC transport system permease protein n=1 Tax=Arthrobacter pigmenti TaxID=271432 RepID=A0A846RS49_9MICC|nr:ABC transporter permease [Arthrobacter pigmenti]NJC23879.1 putative ABC transport system permease protein [Arthrobacter pigmenti]
MYLALRDIRFAKGRFALMGSVVALISLLLVMLSGLTAGLANQSTSGIEQINATTIAFGAPAGNEPKASYTESQVTAKQVNLWEQAAGVSRAEPLGITQTRLQSGGTTNVAVFAADPDGELAPAALEKGEVAVSAQIAEDLDIAVGDTVLISGTELHVAGIIDNQWYSHTPVVWAALSDWRDFAHVSDPDVTGTVIAANYDGDAAGAVAVEDIDAAAETVSTTKTGSFSALGSFSSENGSLTMMQGFLYGISALVIVAFLTVWTVQRTRDIAVLKALGGSNGYVLKDAITQAAIVLLAGATLGGGLGVIGGIFAAQAAPFLTTAATTLLPITGIILLGLAGSAIAVRRVTKVDPLIALGGN